MRMRLAVIVLVAASLGAADRPVKQSKKPSLTDKQMLQGSWVVVTWEEAEAGEEESDPEEEVCPEEILIAGNKFTITMKDDEGGESDHGRISHLDPAKNVKEINIVFGEDQEEETFLGIYKIEGDVLTFCVNFDSGGARPTKFATKLNSQLAVITCQRKKQK